MTGHGADVYKLPLTEAEQRLFETLLTMVKDEGLKTTLRVAGGWVRDKILSHSGVDGQCPPHWQQLAEGRRRREGGRTMGRG